MAISRMQQPRQQYGLGSIVKKAVRGVKKIVKSPIGKAALLYAGTAGLGALGAGKGLSMGMFAPSTVARNVGLSMGRMGLGSKFIGPKQPRTSFLSKLNPFTNPNLSFGQKAFIGGGLGLVAAPFLADAFAPEEVEEEVEDVMDVGGIRQSARDYYQGLGGKNLAFMPQKQYVQKNFYQPNADGGRIGYADGMMVEDEEEEFIRSGAGMSRRQPQAFLNMGGGAGNAQAEQMLMAEYVKYKNKGGTLSFEQFVKAVMQQQQAPEGAGMEQPQAVAMAANGGRIGYSNGGSPFSELEIFKLKQLGFDIESKGVEPFGGVEILKDILRVNRAEGGRIGYKNAGIVNLMSKLKTGMQNVGSKFKSLFDDADISIQVRDEDVITDYGPQAQAVGQDVFIAPKSKKAVKVIEDLIEEGYDITRDAEGEYIINALDEGALDIISKRLRLGGKDIDEFMGNYDDYYSGGDDKMIYEALRNRKAEGGIMETEEASEMIDMGGMEKDFRNEGGFVAMGGKERADDVPARLSKNEFVFTADAVRNAGGGDIDKGAEVMENLMNNLEQGGEVSEDSQGLEGAQAMYDQQQMLQSRMI